MERTDRFAAIYYFLLLLVLISWKSPDVAPPAMLRLAFIAAMVLPATIKYREWMVPVIICFTSISRYSFAFSYLPYEIGIIACVIIGCTILSEFMVKKAVTIPKYLIVLAIYTCLLDLVTGGRILSITYCLCILVCLYYFTDFSSRLSVKYISLAFCIASLVLSVLFLTTRNRYAVVYGEWSAGLERSGWTDPNYFGMAIGMGVVAATIMLFSSNSSILMKVFYFLTIGVSIAASALNASRGAMLSMTFAMGILLFFSKIKTWYKVVVIAIAGVFLVYLFNNSYFELLEYRIQNDSGGGGGRLHIWALKLEEYFQDGNILNMLFGYGGDYGANHLAVSGAMRTTGSHNDYVAMFVNYGPVGLCILLTILFAPLKKFWKNQKNNIPLLASSIYLILCCITLEPLAFGHIPYFAFIFYITVISHNRFSYER